MNNRYYLISTSLCSALGCMAYRKHTTDGRYVVNDYDLACYGNERAVSEGAEEVTLQQLREMNLK